MNKFENISDAMLEDHRKIGEAFINLKSAMDQDNDKVVNCFNILKWKLEKHIFAEEKVIFYYLINSENEFVSHIQKLLKEHEIILAKVKMMEYAIEGNEKVDVDDLRKILNKHEEYEDKLFYPQLDQQLSSEVKKEILERLME